MGEKTITREDFETHFTFIDNLERAFVRYAAEVGIKNANRYSFSEVDEGRAIEFQWYETWSYGGEETHRHCMPWEFLFDYATWKAQHEAEQAEKVRLAAEREVKGQAEREEKERAQLAELKSRYPNG